MEIKGKHVDLYGLVVILASFGSQLCASGIVYCVGVFYVMFLENVTGGSGTLALVTSLNSAVFFGIGPVAGALTEKLGCRLVAMTGGFLGSLGLVLSVFASQPWHLIVTFGVITGIGLGLCYIPAISVVGLHFEKRRTLAMGMAVSGLGAGSVIFPPIITYLDWVYAWRGAILITAGLVLHIMVFASIYRPCRRNRSVDKTVTTPETESNLDKAYESGKEASDTHDMKTKGRVRFNLFVFKSSGFVFFCLCNIFYAFGLSVMNVHMGAYAVSLGYSEDQAAMLFFAAGLASCLGRILFGLIAQIPWLGAVTLLMMSLFSLGLVSSLFPFAWSYEELFGCAALYGFFMASVGSLPPQIVVELLGVDLLPSAYGYVCVACGFGFLMGGPCAGLLYEGTREYQYSFYMGGVLIMTSTLFLIPVWKTRLCRWRPLLGNGHPIKSPRSLTDVDKYVIPE